MSEIKIPISVELGNSLQKLKGLSGELNKVEGDVSDINKESKGTADAIGKIGDAGKKISAEGPATFKAQLRAANEELNRTIVQFGAASPAAQAAAKRVAELKDAIGDAKLLTDAFNPDAKFLAFGNALKGVAGAFSAVQGAQALFGSESKAVQETLLKVQGALALSQGINSVLEAKDAFIALGVQLGIVRTAKIANNAADATSAVVQGASALAAEGLAVAETEVAVATTAAAGSMGILKTALIATGIGAAVVAIGLLVANFDKIKESLTGIGVAEQALADTTEDLQKGLKGAYEETAKVKSAFDLAREGVISKKEALKVYNETLGDSFGKTNDLNEAERRFNAGAQTYVQIQGLKAQANALFAKAAEAAAKGTTAGLEDQTGLWGKLKFAIQAATAPGSSQAVKGLIESQNKGVKEAVQLRNNEAKAINNVAEGLLRQAEELKKQSGLKVDLFGVDDNKAKQAKTKIESVADILKKLDAQIKGLSRLEFVDGIDRTTEKIKLAQEAFDLLVKEKKLTLDDSRLRGVKTLIDSFNVQNLSNQVADVFNNLNNSFKTLEGKRIALGIDVTDDKIKAVQEALNALSGLSIKTDVDITAINNLKATLQGLNVDKLQNQLETGLSDILTREYTLGANLDPEKLKLVQDALKTAFTLGIPSDSPIYAQLNELANRFGKPQEVPLVIKIDTKNGNKSLNELERENLERVKKNAEELAGQISSTIESGLQDAIGSFAEGLGNALTGAGSVGDALTAGLSSLGSTIQQIGKEFLVIAVTVEKVKAFLFKNTALAIVGSIALIAAGAALKSVATKKLATGGFVSGPGTETSDSIPAMLSDGEFVIKASTVKRYGKGFFDRLNQGQLNVADGVAKFNTGGFVQRSVARLSSPIQKFALGGLVQNLTSLGISGAAIGTPIINEQLGQQVPYIATTEIKGQDLRIVLNRANTRFNNTN